MIGLVKIVEKIEWHTYLKFLIKTKDGDSDWFLFVKNDGDEPATLINFKVTFYGTAEDPQPGVPNFVERPQQKVQKL